MNHFISTLPYLIMGTVAVAAVTVLAALNTIGGSQAIAVIAAAVGFALGTHSGQGSIQAMRDTTSEVLNGGGQRPPAGPPPPSGTAGSQ